MAKIAYERHLKLQPSDYAIHVQLGHALKELGQEADAICAYRAALQARPTDVDARWHFINLLIETRNYGEARKNLLDWYAAAPSEPLRNDLIRASGSKRSLVNHEPGTIFFSVQDLFEFLKHYKTMSGIQRVQAGIALSACSSADVKIRFIVNRIDTIQDDLSAGQFWSLSPNLLKKVIEYAVKDRVTHAKLRRFILEAEEDVERVQPRRGDLILLLGAFWGLGNSVFTLTSAWQAGVKIGAYIYDIIPINNPEFCDPTLVRDFSMCFSEICRVADFFIAISDFTKSTVEKYMEDENLAKIPVVTVPLAHALIEAPENSSAWPAALDHLNNREFVTYVSTIEARKNHLYVVRAWKSLIDEGVDVPDLLFVGRRGWRVDPLMQFLRETNNLGGRVHIVHDISDGALAEIYARCLFTVFTSVTEGWGLPVGESLVYGAFCVASCRSSVPEVAGDFVEYVDPENLTQGVEVFRRLICDRKYLTKRRDNIRAHFKPRHWEEVSQSFIEVVRKFLDEPTEKRAAVPAGCDIEPGRRLLICGLSAMAFDVTQYVRHPQRLLLSSFYEPDLTGARMRGCTGRFDLQTNASIGEIIEIHLQLRPQLWALNNYLQITVSSVGVASGGEIDPRIVDSLKMDDLGRNLLRRSTTISMGALLMAGSIRFTAVVGHGGLCVLNFDILGALEVPCSEDRSYALSLEAIGYAQIDSAAALTRLMHSYVVSDVELA